MVYTLGLIFAILLILISVDDLVWDLYYLFIGKTKGKQVQTINDEELKNAIPKFLAVIVPAYNEETVLEKVVENLILSNHYPRSMYHIFLGVYPNDKPTKDVADRLAQRFTNVHSVVHVLDGPSSKADNLNNVIKNIYEFEKAEHIRFKGVIIHDSEDLVHPYEFLLENYLLDKHKAIQMPVFPLQEMPRFSNIFRNMISGTYADEFAENHYNFLVARDSVGSFVPSAGTGFALSREILDKFKDNNIFPVGSLTEDYKLSLQLKQMGYSLHYALGNVKRLRHDGTLAKEFISTRSMFPATYKTAVKQKTRWIYGITIQSFKLKDILKNKDLNLKTKYSLYKDWKAKFGNLLLGPGYLIFIYFIISLFIDIPTIYPKYTLSWYLVIFLTIIMIERQISRGIAIKNVYGFKSAFISVLFPPLLPIRMLIGNVINFHATARAWKIYFFKSKKKRVKTKVKWSKTEHEFLEENVLKTFRRNLGDVLLNDKLITSEDLSLALNESRKREQRLGVTLRELDLVSEENILRSLCKVTHDKYIDLNSDMILPEYIEELGKNFLMENLLVPLIKTSNEYIFVISEPDNKEALEESLKQILGNELKVTFVYTTKNNIIDALMNTENNKCIVRNIDIIKQYIDDGLIELNVAVLALSYCIKDMPIERIFETMGVLIPQKEKC